MTVYRMTSWWRDDTKGTNPRTWWQQESKKMFASICKVRYMAQYSWALSQSSWKLLKKVPTVPTCSPSDRPDQQGWWKKPRKDFVMATDLITTNDPTNNLGLQNGPGIFGESASAMSLHPQTRNSPSSLLANGLELVLCPNEDRLYWRRESSQQVWILSMPTQSQ